MTTTKVTSSESAACVSLNDSRPIGTKAAFSDLYTKTPDELLFLAVHLLCENGLDLVEFRSPLYARMNVPVIIVDYTYLVNDTDLPKVKDVLLDHGFRLRQPPDLILKTEGDLIALGTLFALTQSNKPGEMGYLILLPTSFAHFEPGGLETSHNLPPPNSSIHYLPPARISYPTPPAVYACLIRLLSRYPRAGPTRINLLSDLSMLVLYDLYGCELGDPLHEIAPEDVPDVQNALKRIKDWTSCNSWREGEQWMGDALKAIVGGSGNSDYLPWTGKRESQSLLEG